MGLGGSRTPDRAPPQSYGLWDHEKTSEVKQVDSSEGEEKEEAEEAAEAAEAVKAAVSPPLVVVEEWPEAPAQPEALGAATEPELEPEPEGKSVEQKEGTEAPWLRFRRRRSQGRKTPETVPGEGEHQFPALTPW